VSTAAIPTTAGSVVAWMQNANGTRNYGIDWDGKERILVRDQTDDVFTRFLASAPVRIAQLEEENAKLRALNPKTKIRIFDGGCVRQDPNGVVWLLNTVEKGWSAYGYRFDGWHELLAKFDLVVGAPKTDRHGLYWPASPQAETAVAS
jgi:hypothetical protein